MRFVDLFCGIGGFHLAAVEACRSLGISSECAFACDIDPDCRRVYEANFGFEPVGDVTTVLSTEIPDHDLLLAGFPCQPFSIAGAMRGFEDTRGTLFFEIARILDAKRPAAFVLENVKALAGHRKGETLRTILETLRGLGYRAEWRVLNALDFGLPQKRERVFIVGFKDSRANFEWPTGGARMRPLSALLERSVADKFFASEDIRRKRAIAHRPGAEPTIWHENKSGHVSKHPFSCALRAGASHNYLLVDGVRRLTEREMLRLQGFPEDFQIVCNYSQTRRQAGNAVPVPVASAVIRSALKTIF